MKFQVFNATDGIPATPGSFPTIERAERFIAQFRSRFEASGYLTSSCERIPASEIRLEIISSGSKKPSKKTQV